MRSALLGPGEWMFGLVERRGREPRPYRKPTPRNRPDHAPIARDSPTTLLAENAQRPRLYAQRPRL